MLISQRIYPVMPVIIVGRFVVAADALLVKKKTAEKKNCFRVRTIHSTYYENSVIV